VLVTSRPEEIVMADQVLSITDKALARVVDIIAREPDGAELALEIRVAGVRDGRFNYEMAMIGQKDIAPADHREVHGLLTVTIPADSVENIAGATLDESRDLLKPGLVLNNPNNPSPRIAADGPSPELTGPVEQRVMQVLDHEINPSIAAHGGVAELVAVEGGTAYLRLGGGCQGCGMASVTLSQGIEHTIREAIPEITGVIDVTDHSSGQNPYYEAAKK
jgi:Fe/S biogenesis protein NfuA